MPIRPRVNPVAEIKGVEWTPTISKSRISLFYTHTHTNACVIISKRCS